MMTAPTSQKKERGALREEFGNPERRSAYYMILPALLIILVVAFYPIGYAVYLSFFKANINNAGNFVGLQNYVQMFQNSEFIEGLRNTLIFTVVSVSLEFVIGLAIALAINRAFKRRGLVRAAVLVPWALPTVTVTVVIPNFATVYTVDYGAQAAAAVVVTVPLVLLVLIFQRRIVSGLTAGAVKG